jgi:hypothetical protein
METSFGVLYTKTDFNGVSIQIANLEITFFSLGEVVDVELNRCPVEALD